MTTKFLVLDIKNKNMEIKSIKIKQKENKKVIVENYNKNIAWLLFFIFLVIAFSYLIYISSW